MILKLNEEVNNLKLIQVNDGFVVVDLKNLTDNNIVLELGSNKNNREPYIGETFYPDNDGTVSEEVLKRDLLSVRYKGHYITLAKAGVNCAKIIYATPNLNLKSVPEIEEKDVLSYIQNLLDTKAKKDNKVDLNAYGNGLIDGYKQAQQNLFTEDEVLLLVAEAICKFKLGQLHDSKQIEESLKSLKQPKVEITFEDDETIKCVML